MSVNYNGNVYYLYIYMHYRLFYAWELILLKLNIHYKLPTD